MHPDSGRKNPMRWRKAKGGEHELHQEGVLLAIIAPVPGRPGRWYYRTLCCGEDDVSTRDDGEDWCSSESIAKDQAMGWVRRHRVRETTERECPRCKAHVAVHATGRPAIGCCFGCGRQFSIWPDESVHPLCACGTAHDEKGHPYSVGEARRYLDVHGPSMEQYGRSLFEFLLTRAEATS